MNSSAAILESEVTTQTCEQCDSVFATTFISNSLVAEIQEAYRLSKQAI